MLHWYFVSHLIDISPISIAMKYPNLIALGADTYACGPSPQPTACILSTSTGSDQAGPKRYKHISSEKSEFGQTLFKISLDS